jgi:hypothetical protein
MPGALCVGCPLTTSRLLASWYDPVSWDRENIDHWDIQLFIKLCDHLLASLVLGGRHLHSQRCELRLYNYY